MKKYMSASVLCAALALFLSSAAYAQELAVGGQAVGIQVELGGVAVAGLSSVETAEGEKTPAADAGLCDGDYIIRIGEREIKSTADFVDAVAASGGAEQIFTVRRGESDQTPSLTPVMSKDGKWAVGIWLRDGVSGIGTLTFYDQDTGTYGALGHCISIIEGGSAVKVENGTVSGAEILSVTPGTDGKPGALNGCTDVEEPLGDVDRNCSFGIYGRAYSAIGGDVYETGEISTGRAVMLSTVEGRNTRAYDIEINRVCSEPDGCHVVLTVTDPELCAVTGGIVQGMSGSPIIQNGKLVGAVTHVFVSDPKKGYGVSIDDMLKAAGIAA